MKTKLTKKLNAFGHNALKSLIALCLLVLLQSNKSVAQIYARIEMTNVNRTVSPQVVYDQATATMVLYSDASFTTHYTAPTGGIDIYFNETVNATSNIGTSGVNTLSVHVDGGEYQAYIFDETLHYWQFYDDENTELMGQSMSTVSVVEDPNNSTSYNPEETYYDFDYDYFDATLSPGPWPY